MSFIDVEVESNTEYPMNNRYRVAVGDTIGSLLNKIDFESLETEILSPEVAVLSFHGKVLSPSSTFEQNGIHENDVLKLRHC